ncbi:MAG: prephenate dehydratase domain-containing protein, partial [Hyphomicrobiales bacterium]
MRVAYLGPAGTFGEEAALRYARGEELLPFPSHGAVAAAVESGMADAGVVAIENSINGSVAETLDILIHETSLQIQAELVLPIVHNLVARPGTR